MSITLLLAATRGVLASAEGAESQQLASFKFWGKSMVPTIDNGEVLQLDTSAYRRHRPQRGDLIVLELPLRPPHGRHYYTVKRVIGLPGETVEVRKGSVFIDGKRLNEPYVRDRAGYRYAARRILRGQYFVLGDNRDNSEDSHIFGPLRRKFIIGKVILPPAT